MLGDRRCHKGARFSGIGCLPKSQSLSGHRSVVLPETQAGENRRQGLRARGSSRVVTDGLLVVALHPWMRGHLPRLRVAGNGLLNGLAKGQIGGAAHAGANEVAFVQGQASCQGRHFDQSAAPLRRHRRHAQPSPAAPNHFAISAVAKPRLSSGNEFSPPIR
jgi:hypothetical protein